MPVSEVTTEADIPGSGGLRDFQRKLIYTSFVAQLEHLRQVVADKRIDLERDEVLLAKAEEEYAQLQKVE